MRSIKGCLSILIVLSLVLILSSTAISEWWLTDDEEEIILLRVDNDSDTPLHEQTEGKYGYWNATDDFVLVVNFEGGSGPVSPYTWDDVKWIRGHLDK